jgi:hypothetical protein
VSAAADNQLVHPRFEAPVMQNDFISRFHSCFASACTTSIALTALLTIGKRRGQFGSLLSM